MGAGFIVPKKSVLVVTQGPRRPHRLRLGNSRAPGGGGDPTSSITDRPACSSFPLRSASAPPRPPGDPELIVRDRRSYRYRAVRDWRHPEHGPCLRRPEPAYFRVTHPDGIDPGPPEYLQIQEFEAAILAARPPPASPSEGHRLRFVCADCRTQPPPKAGCSCRTSAVSASSRLATCNGSRSSRRRPDLPNRTGESRLRAQSGGTTSTYRPAPSSRPRASRARTGDLLGAIQALSQLSYSPAQS